MLSPTSTKTNTGHQYQKQDWMEPYRESGHNAFVTDYYTWLTVLYWRVTRVELECTSLCEESATVPR